MSAIADTSAVEATLADCVALAHAHAACFDPGWSADEFRAHLEPSTGVALKIADPARASEVAGVVLARAAADEGEILTLAVTPGFRRSGLAARLLSQLESVLARRGARQLYLEVAADNTGAIALYRAAGFAETGRRKAYYVRRDAPMVDAIVLAKSIASPR